MVRGEKLLADMEKRGIYVKAVSMPGAAEEAGIGYKYILLRFCYLLFLC